MSDAPRFVPPPEPPPPPLPEARDGSILRWVDRLFAPLSPATVERSAVAVTLALGVLDYTLGPEFYFSIVYFVPIGLAAWYGTGRSVYYVCGLAISAWLVSHILSGASYDPPWILAWNVGVRLATFLVVAALALRLREALKVQVTLASSDPLTGLANTRAFLDRLENEIERAGRYGRIFTVAYVDLDHFKEVNDTLGHAEGDEVLRTVASAMDDSMRATDMAARLGGDEFGILLPETPFAQAGEALNKLREEVLRRMQPKGWPVTISVGAVTFEAPVESADDAIRIADRIMYQVKNEGRNAIRQLLWTGEEAVFEMEGGPEPDSAPGPSHLS